jgi:hypothetical protein
LKIGLREFSEVSNMLKAQGQSLKFLEQDMLGFWRSLYFQLKKQNKEN